MNPKMIIPLLVVIATVLSVTIDAGAAEKDPAGAAGEVPRMVTIESVKGSAEYSKDGKWLPLKRGQKISELTVIRTGFGANVVLHFRDDTRVTVSRCTKMGIRRCRDRGRTTNTRLDLKYGTLRSKVDSSRAPNDFRVNVHGTVLAVTGTGGNTTFWPDSGMDHHSTEHTWNIRNAKGEKNLDENLKTDDDLTPSDTITKRDMATGQGDGYGLTREEKDRLIDHGSGRGIFDGLGDDPTRVPRGGSHSERSSSGSMPTGPTGPSVTTGP